MEWIYVFIAQFCSLFHSVQKAEWLQTLSLRAPRVLSPGSWPFIQQKRSSKTSTDTSHIWSHREVTERAWQRSLFKYSPMFIRFCCKIVDSAFTKYSCVFFVGGPAKRLEAQTHVWRHWRFGDSRSYSTGCYRPVGSLHSVQHPEETNDRPRVSQNRQHRQVRSKAWYSHICL